MTNNTVQEQFLRYKVYRGLADYGLADKQEYIDRAEYELGVINQCKFANYFLIVGDLCRFMLDSGIRFVVRGSGCGSLCVYALKISHQWLDPIKLDLPFERFLNPERISNPDLDIDIQDDRRAELVEYTIQKYGKDKVAKIATFATLGPKRAIQHMARAFKLPNYQELALQMTSTIAVSKGVTIQQELETNEHLREQERKYPDLFSMAQKVEGKVSQASVHAAGTIITPETITNILPIWFPDKDKDPDGDVGFPCIQWDMYDAEERGLLKMDYLGSRTLRIIDQTVGMINIQRKHEGKEPNFDISQIPKDDPETWKMFKEGRLTGVFQVERTYVQRFAQRMDFSRRDIWDIAVLISIIRPGMMDAGTTEQYLNRAEGKEAPTPPHRLLAHTFDKTFGIMCFQEDVMATARDFAGFTRAKADVLRKGVGKKDKRFIDKMYPEFEKGALVKGATPEEVKYIWGLIEAHARYSFNNAHAAAYAMIAYWTGWLKCHHTLFYMNALINSESGFTSKDDGYNYKVAEYVEEARFMGIKIEPPCVKQSGIRCQAVPKRNAIRFGLSLVKGVTASGASWIVSHARHANSFKDFVLAAFEQVQDDGKWKVVTRVRKDDIEALIVAGAMDVFAPNQDRAKLLAMLPQVLEITKTWHEQTVKLKNGSKRLQKTPQDMMDNLENYTIEDGDPSVVEQSLEDMLEQERAYTGCYLSHSPFTPFSDIVRKYCTATPEELGSEDGYDGFKIFVGILKRSQVITCKNGKSAGKEMAFLEFVGIGGFVECTVFPKTWEGISKQNGFIEKGKVYMVSVRQDSFKRGHVIEDIRRLSNCYENGEVNPFEPMPDVAVKETP